MTTAGDFHRTWRALPIGGLDDVIGGGTCLVLAPHPDDESLGCGGLIAACVAAGRLPLVVVLTDGAGSHPNSREFPPQRLRAVRAREVRDAVACLGLPPDRVVLLGQPDTAAPHDGPRFDAVVARLTGLVRQQAACTAILAPWRHDPHCDHEAAALVAAAVAGATAIRHVAYPVWGWTLPPEAPIAETPGRGFRLDVGAALPAKHAAIHAHRSQYGGLITDDPAGFELPRTLLSAFDGAFETFVPGPGGIPFGDGL
jgi:LmbE family N-acetylglucosaminyl deacetylase